MDQTVSQTAATTGPIRANVSGEISGQVAVGNYILQIGSVHGGVVNINMPDQRPRLRARPTPVYVLPRHFSGLLDRVDEVAAAASALPASQPVEFHAQNGMGKTSLLRVLARHSLVTAFGEGVIYLSARDQTPADLLQSIFDALFEYDAPYKPSEGEIRHALQGKRALILLDDVELSREEVESLFDAAPQCAFLLATPDRKLWSEGLSLNLPGLPAQEARSLLERELGRKLSEEETAAAEALLSALSGNPLAIIQAAALIRENGYSLKSLVAGEQDAQLDRKIAALSLGFLTNPERQIVASIASVDGAPLNAKHLPALTGISPVEPELERLQKRGLIQQNGKGFTLAGSFALFVQESWDLANWREGLLGYFRAWATARLQEPDKILEDAGAILRLIEWANQSGRWEGALELAKVVEGVLALGLRWGAWEKSLQHGLEAAQAMGNLRAKAWALHQLGTRALGLGERAAARHNLIQALRFRERLGDRAGSAVTRHNLNLLLGPLDGNNGDSTPRPPSNPAGSLYNLALGTLTTLVVSGVLLSAALLVFGFIIPRPPASPVHPPLAPSLAITMPVEQKISETSGSLTPSPSPSPTATLVEATGATTLTATELIPTTPTPSQTELPTLTLTQCAPQQGWPVYTIRQEDTLWSIAQASGSSVGDLMTANCLRDSRIFPGQPLFVPRLPVYPLTDTPTPTYTPTTVTPEPQFPDLIISLQIGPVERLDTEGVWIYYGTSLTVTISNLGKEVAGPFRVVVYSQGNEPAGLTVLQEDPSIEPLVLPVDDPLEAGASRSISARLEFLAPSSWQTFEARAVADDCNGLQQAEPCQVEESDEQNNQSATQKVSLPENLPPTVKITNIVDEETILRTKPEGEQWFVEIVLEGYAEDPEDGLLDGGQLVWTTDRIDLQDGYLNTGAAVPVWLFSDRCAATTHTVTLTATDRQAAASSDSRRITLVGGDCTPRLAVEIPYQETYTPTGYEKDRDQFFLDLSMQAWAYDVLNRPIGGDRIEWTTDRIDIQDKLLGFGENLDLRLYLPNDPEQCDQVTHTVRVTATDLEGNQADESFPIRIVEDCSELN